MRAPSRGSARRPESFGRGAVLLALALLATTGCAKRFSLIPAELEKVQAEENLKSLSVYTSKRLVTTWVEGQVQENFDVNKGDIQQGSARQRLKNVVPKTVPGRIISIEDLNGMPLLWVTFDGSCNEPDCAFGFVQTEDKLYRLFQAPTLEGYGPPQNHHACLSKRRVMKLGKMKSLSEANDVMVNKKKNGKLRTIWLEVIKEVDDRVRTRSRRSGGVKPE
ncbi:MAG: hypothetical protein KDK70_08400 [Myxococcales bacterium]|nr:hypothetical protein [Myxococcales bacterium]